MNQNVNAGLSRQQYGAYLYYGCHGRLVLSVSVVSSCSISYYERDRHDRGR